jgi:flagellar motor switch protein FliG
MLRSNYVDKQGMEMQTTANSAAALMVLLGDDLASEIMSHLDPGEIQQLSVAINQVSGQESDYADHLDHLLDMHDFPKTPSLVS